MLMMLLYWSTFVVLFYSLPQSQGAVPHFTTEPMAATKLKGFSVTLSCKISSVAFPAYYWLKDGRNVTRGTQGDSNSVSTLTIVNVQFTDMGNYSCVAYETQTANSWTSATATLTVEGRADITQPPLGVSSHEGQSALFYCVTISNPQPTVSWRDPQDNSISTTGRFEVLHNGTLKIHNLRKRDGGLYKCIASNSFGDTSASATLTVLDPPSTPVFTTKPQNLTAKEGTRITFHCDATGVPTPSISWSRIAGQFPSNRSENPSPDSLRITGLKPSDQGLYLCTAKNSEGIATAHVYLRIEGFPQILTGPTDKVVPETLSVVFSCVISGDPPPYVEWTIPNGTIYTLQDNPLGDVRVLVNNSLVISVVTAWSDGTYVCAAVNSVGKKTSTAKLTVLTVPWFTSALSNITQNVNTSLGVECTAKATPSPEFQWIFSGTVVATNSELSIGSLRMEDEGIYLCRVNNSRGSTRGSFYLRVQVPPEVVTRPGNQTVGTGNTAVFPCHVTGDPEPTITWYKSRDPLSNDARFSILSNGTLIVRSVRQQEAGWYTCEARSDAGRVQERAFLTVTDLPMFSVRPQDTNISEFSSLVMSCRAEAAETPVISWFIEDSDGNLQNLPSGAKVTPADDVEILSVTRSNMGVYVCKACNTAGCDKAKAVLTVFFSPSFPSPPKSVGVLQGQTAVLKCQPEASPPAEITWRRPDQQMMSGTSYQQIVTNVQPEDTGEYSCQAANSLGSTGATVRLSIDTKAMIKDFIRTSNSNNKISIQCAVIGKPTPVIIWSIGDVTLPNKTVYQHYEVTINKELDIPAGSLQSNTFVCNASNPHASDIRLARVPNPPGNVTAAEIRETSILIKWPGSSPPEQLVLEYVIELQPIGGQWKSLNKKVITTSVNISGLDAFTPYRFRVGAVNGLGSSNYSQPSHNITTLEGAPSIPQGLKLVAQNASVVLATWSAPSNLSGLQGNLKYLIISKTGNSSSERTVDHVSGGDPQRTTLDRLQADTLYKVTVRAGRRRNDGVERWSGDSAQKLVKTLQLVPLTPPVDLTIASNGPHQIMVKWKAPPYSIDGYIVSYRVHESAEPFKDVTVPGGLETVYVIMDLKEDTQYEIKARMYSNTGNGRFSDPRIVKTDVDKFTGLSERSGTGVAGSIELKVAIGGLLGGLLLLLIIVAYGCYRRMQATRSKQNFEIESRYQDPSQQYVVSTTDSEGDSFTEDSEGSVEGQYNFQADEDSIDLAMFSGDLNSCPVSVNPEASVNELRYVNPADLRFKGEDDDPGDYVKLESFSPKYSPMPPRQDQVAYAQINPKTSRNSSPDNDTGSCMEDYDGPPEGGFVNMGFAHNETLSSSTPTLPKKELVYAQSGKQMGGDSETIVNEMDVYAQVNKSGKQTGGDSEATVDEVAAFNAPYETLSSFTPTLPKKEQVYAQVNKSGKQTGGDSEASVDEVAAFNALPREEYVYAQVNKSGKQTGDDSEASVDEVAAFNALPREEYVYAQVNKSGKQTGNDSEASVDEVAAFNALPREEYVYAQVNKSGKQTGNDSEASVNAMAALDVEIGPHLPALYVDMDQATEKMSKDDENFLDESEGSDLGSRKGSFVDWPPPPPSLMDPRFASDDLASARDRVASWADD